MRVQSINQNYLQNYKKQNAPSFQATACLISKKPCGKREIHTAVGQLTTLLFENGNRWTTILKPVWGNGRRSAKHGVPHCIMVNTGVNEEAVSSILRKYAEGHGFCCKISPSPAKHANVLEIEGRTMAQNFARDGHF